MHTFEHLRRCAALAAGILATGALAAFGSAPALAQTHIYGGGAALQNQLQNDILIPDSPLSSDITFTASTSGNGFNEFGNSSGTLGLGKGYDKVADLAGQLDAYVAVDSGPTGPLTTSGTNLYEANKASGTDEITVPVAQTPLDILLSLPANLTLNSGTEVKLSNQLVSNLFAGTVPSQTGVNAGYTENTWGAFLVDAGLNGDFTDSDSAGDTTIKIEVRKEGAGTTLNLKQYLFYVDSELGGGPWESPIKEDETACNGTDEWPTTATTEPCTAGNSTDADEVLAVDANPGTVGYATAGDAASNPDLAGHSPKVFTSTPVESTDPPSVDGTASAEHQILYAEVQDDGTEAASHFADPEVSGSPGKPNIYTESNIQVNSSGSGVGNWIVPFTGVSTFNPEGTWSGTRASDPDVFDETGDEYYPIVAVAYDLSWANFSATKLVEEANYTSEAGVTAQEFLKYATTLSEGQTAIGTYGVNIGEDDYYYAPLPTGGTGLANIQKDAHKAAEAVG
jgi:hypothetical protein